MPNNPKRRGAGVSQSFTPAEVHGMSQLYEAASRGADARRLLQTAPVLKVLAKFKRMEAKLREQVAQKQAAQEDFEYWVERLQTQVRGFEMYGPKDGPNPVQGSYTIVGPLTEYRHSSSSFAHAAMLYLAQVCRDREAIEALKAV